MQEEAHVETQETPEKRRGGAGSKLASAAGFIALALVVVIVAVVLLNPNAVLPAAYTQPTHMGQQTVLEEGSPAVVRYFELAHDINNRGGLSFTLQRRAQALTADIREEIEAEGAEDEVSGFDRRVLLANLYEALGDEAQAQEVRPSAEETTPPPPPGPGGMGAATTNDAPVRLVQLGEGVPQNAALAAVHPLYLDLRWWLGAMVLLCGVLLLVAAFAAPDSRFYKLMGAGKVGKGDTARSSRRLVIAGGVFMLVFGAMYYGIFLL